jgi:hypothetical protein
MSKDFTSALFRFAFFPKYEEHIKFLAENIADIEQWDFSDTKEKKFVILRNYLDYYYLRLKEESKICFTKDNEFCIFNTGLVTRNQEDIFAFFQVNKSTTPGSPYYFKCFLKQSDPLLLEKFGESFPEPAYFFEKPELLLVNPKYKIIPDIEHIIEDNKGRFPLHLQNADNAELRRQIKGAIEDVTKKVRTNYKIAIPQYFDGKVQLLLPLCLTSGSPNPDLALVISKVPGQEIYSAITCLTLKMAYNNARLIVKPQSDWLKP